MTCRRVVALRGPGPREARGERSSTTRGGREGRRRPWRAVAAREAEALDAARHCAEAARAAVSALEQYFDGAELPHAANAKEFAKELAGGTPAAAPPAAAKLKRDAADAAARVEALAAAAARATRGMRWARTRTWFSGVGLFRFAKTRARRRAGRARRPGCEKQNASSLKEIKADAEKRPGDADKRRRVGVGRLAAQARVAMDAGEKERDETPISPIDA